MVDYLKIPNRSNKASVSQALTGCTSSATSLISESPSASLNGGLKITIFRSSNNNPIKMADSLKISNRSTKLSVSQALTGCTSSTKSLISESPSASLNSGLKREDFKNNEITAPSTVSISKKVLRTVFAVSSCLLLCFGLYAGFAGEKETSISAGETSGLQRSGVPTEAENSNPEADFVGGKRKAKALTELEANLAKVRNAELKDAEGPSKREFEEAKKKALKILEQRRNYHRIDNKRGRSAVLFKGMKYGPNGRCDVQSWKKSEENPADIAWFSLKKADIEAYAENYFCSYTIDQDFYLAPIDNEASLDAIFTFAEEMSKFRRDSEFLVSDAGERIQLPEDFSPKNMKEKIQAVTGTGVTTYEEQRKLYAKHFAGVTFAVGIISRDAPMEAKLAKFDEERGTWHTNDQGKWHIIDLNKKAGRGDNNIFWHADMDLSPGRLTDYPADVEAFGKSGFYEVLKLLGMHGYYGPPNMVAFGEFNFDADGNPATFMHEEVAIWDPKAGHIQIFHEEVQFTADPWDEHYLNTNTRQDLVPIGTRVSVDGQLGTVLGLKSAEHKKLADVKYPIALDGDKSQEYMRLKSQFEILDEEDLH